VHSQKMLRDERGLTFSLLSRTSMTDPTWGSKKLIYANISCCATFQEEIIFHLDGPGRTNGKSFFVIECSQQKTCSECNVLGIANKCMFSRYALPFR
jgi:hypothetical protein